MSAAVMLIVFVAGGEGDDATSHALVRATRAALGADSQVEVREARELPADATAVVAQDQAHADAVAELTWADATHRRARLHVHVARTGRWIDRSIGFQASDQPAERGRTLGFAIASMLPEAWESSAAPPAPSAAPTPPAGSASPPGGAAAPTASAPPPAPALAPAPARALAPALAPAPAPALAPARAPSPTLPPAPLAAPTPPTPSTSPSAEPAAPSAPTADFDLASPSPHPPRRLERLTLDVLGIGALSPNADVDSGGAAGAVAWYPWPLVSLRVGGGARLGSVPAAQATTLTAFGAAGLALHPIRATESHRLGLWIRVDYLAQHASMTHFSSATASSATLDRWLSGVDALVGVDWMFAPNVGVVLGVGGEEVFSSTYVVVAGAPAATLAPLRAVGEAGLRLRF